MKRMISPLRIGDFFQKRLEPIFEFSAKFRAGDHRADIHRDDPFLFQRFRHVAADDSPRQPFHDRGLANTGIADEHRIIFRAAGKDLHDAPDLVVASDDRIDFSARASSVRSRPYFSSV